MGPGTGPPCSQAGSAAQRAPPVAAGDRLGDADEAHRGDHGDDEAEDVELPDAAGAQQAGDDAADDRAGHPEAQGGEDAEVLPSRYDKARQGADDESGDEKADHDGPSVRPAECGSPPRTNGATGRFP